MRKRKRKNNDWKDMIDSPYDSWNYLKVPKGKEQDDG